MLAIGLANTYVVATLDLEATLREVVNPAIRTEIQAVKPVKCLMYLDFVRAHSLSFGSMPANHSLLLLRSANWYTTVPRRATIPPGSLAPACVTPSLRSSLLLTCARPSSRTQTTPRAARLYTLSHRSRSRTAAIGLAQTWPWRCA